MVYNEMSKYTCENNWANEVMGLRIRYGLSNDDWYVETTGINEWKRTVRYTVSAFLLLKSQCKENKKTHNLCLEKYLESEYLTSLPPLLARLVFKARSRMYNVQDNFKGQLQRFHKLISNDRIWPSEHGFEVIFEKSLFVFEISASKVRNKRGIHSRFHSFSENNNREILVCDVTSDQSSMISTERSDLRDCKASGNCYV